MKPKEWLYKNGHMTREEADKRGRMSLVNKALVEEAVANGVVIDGYAIVAKPTAVTAKPTVGRVEVDTNRVIDVPEPVRDSRDFVVLSKTTKKPIHAVGPANICNGCRSSFTYCPCENPRIWLDNEHETVVEFSYTNR